MTTVNRHTYMERFRQEQKRLGMRRVSVTLTAHEYQHLHASARDFGERVTSHLKRRALAHLKAQAMLPPEVQQRLDHLLSVMRGI